MKIGVRGHDIRIKDNISGLTKRAKELGFDCIQLVPKKVLMNINSDLNEQLVQEIRTDLESNDFEVALLGAYFNPVHSNKIKLRKEIEEFKTYLKYANQLGCPYVGTETGSFNDDIWTYHPNNHTEEAFLEVCDVVKELVETAEAFDSYVAIEPAIHHVVYNPNMLKRLIECVHSNHLVIIIDIYNLLNIHNYHNYKNIFNEYVEQFKDKIKFFHFKDFIIENNELVKVGLGEGYIDYDYILEVINQYVPDAVAIFEGVVEEKLLTSITHIKSLEVKRAV